MSNEAGSTISTQLSRKQTTS